MDIYTFSKHFTVLKIIKNTEIHVHFTYSKYFICLEYVEHLEM